MTNDEIKQLLYNYPKLNNWIQDYESDLENIREQISKHYSVGASVISDMPRGTGISNKTLEAVERIDELKETYIEQADYTAKKLKELYQQKRVIDDVFPLLTPTQQHILEIKYFKKLTWDDVAEQDPQQRCKRVFDHENGKMYNIIRKLAKEKEGI